MIRGGLDAASEVSGQTGHLLHGPDVNGCDAGVGTDTCSYGRCTFRACWFRLSAGALILSAHSPIWDPLAIAASSPFFTGALLIAYAWFQSEAVLPDGVVREDPRDEHHREDWTSSLTVGQFPDGQRTARDPPSPARRRTSPRDATRVAGHRHACIKEFPSRKQKLALLTVPCVAFCNTEYTKSLWPRHEGREWTPTRSNSGTGNPP